MSKLTFAVVAAGGAAAGAAATAILYSSQRNSLSDPTRTKAHPSPVPSSHPISPVPSQTSIPPPSPVDPSGLFQYGFPGPVSDLNPATSLTSAYDRRTRNPAWVAEHITPTSLSTRVGDRKHSIFAEDETIPSAFRAKLSDYFRSGYDRGHQVPAADAKWSQQAMNDTFYLSNICPQVGEGFNRDYWAHFEDFCRRLTGRYESVRIVTGPLYLPRRESDGKWRVNYEVIGSPPNVAVPTHFFKVVYGEMDRKGGADGRVSLGAFVLPNAPISNDKPLTDFEVPVEFVERASGLEFAALLPVERRKQLCKEVPCSLIVKNYEDRQKTFAKEISAPRRT